jgi:hypothetical protein
MCITLLTKSLSFFFSSLHPSPGTVVMQVTATDADDATYGNSARVVYSILQGQPYFSVDPNTGQCKQAPYLSSSSVDRKER